MDAITACFSREPAPKAITETRHRAGCPQLVWKRKISVHFNFGQIPFVSAFIAPRQTGLFAACLIACRIAGFLRLRFPAHGCEAVAGRNTELAEKEDRRRRQASALRAGKGARLV